MAHGWPDADADELGRQWKAAYIPMGNQKTQNMNHENRKPILI
jgi:hypothetical protein